jgi:chorismate dehydratase
MIRVGAVDYLNARPLVAGMELPPLSERFRVLRATPAECARRLHAGDVDLALLPSIEYARSTSPLEIVQGIAIGSKGPVSSVLLFTRVPPPDVRSIALNAASRTTNALVTLLFAEEGARPELTVREPDLEAMLAEHDAAVLIGDDALFAEAPPGVRVIDLGDAWTATHEGHPFVYAFWAARPGVLDRRDYRMIHASKSYGRAHLDEIAGSFEYRGRRDPERCRRYLEKSISYRLGSRQLAGLMEFYARCTEHGIIERVPEMRFLPLRRTRCQQTAAGQEGV